MTATETRTACIGEPISWLRLETFALGGGDRAIGAHVEACPACRHCLDEIRRDVVALPVLEVPLLAPRRRWWTFAMPAFAAVAAAAILLFVLRPRDGKDEDVARVKGLRGEVVLDVLRERAGIVRDDVRTFAPGDRWKVVVTCAADQHVWLDVAVVEQGARSADHPLAPARVVCGNRVFVPGAFELTGDKPHRICVRVATTAAPLRAFPGTDDDSVACVTVRAN